MAWFVETLANASTAFLDAYDLRGADVVGSSMGPCLVAKVV
jgi:pimeloyl-ACP methyl ester carboxylesterase